MKVNFVSINPVTNIPSLRYFVNYFICDNNAIVEITEIHIKNINNYYKNSSSIFFDNIIEYKNHEEYNQKKHDLTYKKYIKVIRKIIEIFWKKNQYIITTDFQVLFFIFLLKPFFRKPQTKIIYHQFELIEEEFLGKINMFFYKKILKKSHLIDLAIFPEINRQHYFTDRSTIIVSKCMIIPNTCEIPNYIADRHPIFNTIPSDKIIVGHVGNVGGKDHYFDPIINVINRLNNNPKLFFVFIGYQSDEIKTKVKNLKINNILFVDAVPHEELASIYNYIDIGLILYKGVSPNFEMCAPNKLYEYWSYGISVIAHHLTGLKEVFKTHEQGSLINFDDVEEIENAILTLESNNLNRKKLQHYFNENLNISKFIKEFDLKLKSI